MRDLDYLKLLSDKYENIEKTGIEISNLNAILSLPKGTELFFSDLHGENESFIHLLRAGAGFIRSRIKKMFSGRLTDAEVLDLANIIYFPEEKLNNLDFNNENTYEFQKDLILNLIEIVKYFSSKHSRSNVRKSIKKEYVYIVEELLYKSVDLDNKKKESFYSKIIDSMIEIHLSKKFIICLCDLIRKQAIERLHIVGDIFDRGPRADLIIDELINYNVVDIEWGNHDIEWIGASLGNDALICTALRNSIRYNLIDMLEEGYGISLRALDEFASTIYKDDPCTNFEPKILDENQYDILSKEKLAKMQKALSILQFKFEGKLIKKHPEMDMNDRILLERINFDEFTIDIDGKIYELNDKNFPTIDKNDPLKLSKEEEIVFKNLKASLLNSSSLKRHIKFLFDKGSVYKVFNNNLLYHGNIPFDNNGNLYKFKTFDGKKEVSGKEYLDYFEKIITNAKIDFDNKNFNSYNIDYMFYMWCGPKSPFFGKDKIRTFEIYFIDDKDIHKEKPDNYYTYAYEEENAIKILKDFNLDEKAHIINGHIPVKVAKGESPVKANGRLIVIDGGLSKSYQKSTGIAGYTLIYDSIYLTLASHKQYRKGLDNTPDTTEIEKVAKTDRVHVSETDDGKRIKTTINDLKELLNAYREGLIKEKNI